MNQLKLYRVSALIPSTRQAMTGYFFAPDQEAAFKYFEVMTGITKDHLDKNLVCDELPIEDGVITITHNDRAVLMQYFPPKRV